MDNRPVDARYIPAEPAHQFEDDTAFLRSITQEERGRMILSACRTAALIQRGRLASGLPPVEPTPWPPSTVAFLKRHAANVRSEQRR